MGGTFSEPVLGPDDAFEIRPIGPESSEHAIELAQLLAAKLPGLDFDEAVVRTAGASPVPRRNKAQFSRAHAEGAVLYVLREHLRKPIRTGDAQSLARLTGTKKDELEAKAKGLSNSKRDAVVAALSALRHD